MAGKLSGLAIQANTITATQLSNTINLTVSAGTAAAPAITPTGDNNTGIFFPAADTIAFAEGGAEALRIDANGNFGLGVTPRAAFAGYKNFQIASQGYISSDTVSDGELEINNNAYRAPTTAAHTYINSFTATKYAQYRGEHRWFYAASGTAGANITFTQAMTLTASGNLGVGTTSPYAKIQSYTSSSTLPVGWLYRGTQGSSSALPTTFGTPYLQIGSAEYISGGGYIQTIGFGYVSANGNSPPAEIGLLTTSSSGETKGAIVFATRDVTTNTAATERARITSDGAFVVNNTGGDAQIYLGGTSGTNRMYLARSGADSLLWNTSNGAMRFGTNDTERARITSGGLLLVGTTTATNGYVTSDGTFNPTIAGWATSGASFAGVGDYGGGIVLIDGSSAGYAIWTQDSGNDFYIQGNTLGSSLTGGVYLNNFATSWSSASDENVKDIIEPISNAAEKVLSLRSVIGKYKDEKEGKRHPFLIAQDVQKVLPEAVNVMHKGKERECLGLSYTDVIPLLVAAIKEQQAMIEDLKTKVAALENT